MVEVSRSPVAVIDELSTGFMRSQALYAVAKLGVADHIGDGRRGVAELANSVGADKGILYRVMRTLAGFGVFLEENGKVFSLTPAGQVLRDDHAQSLRHAVIFRCEENYDAFRQLLHTVRTGENAFERVFGAPRFEYVKTNQGPNSSFQKAMTAITGAVTDAVLRAYDFSQYNTVVDVGGGPGTLISAILSQSPHLSGILFDQEAPIELARAGAGAPLRECRFVAGNFFEAVPEGGDLYTLKSVLHDWADDPSETILRNCRRAMGENGTLLVIERLIGPPNQPSAVLSVDLTVLVEHGGQERRQNEFEALFDRVGLNLVRVIETDSPFSMMETRAA